MQVHDSTANNPECKVFVPPLLKARQQWLIWRFEGQINAKGKQPKVPYYVNGKRRTGIQGSDADRQALTTFDHAADKARRDNNTGLGFAFLPGDGLIGIDIDNCLNPETGELSQIAVETLAIVSSYTECSPSGKGLHIIAKCEHGETFKDNSKGLEVFAGRQYFTFTGKPFGTVREISEISPQALAQLKILVRGEASPTTSTASMPASGVGSRYALGALDSACKKIASRQEGGRNDTLNMEALGIARLVAGGELAESVARTALEEAGRACGLGQAEIRATLASAFRAGKQQPRTAPQKQNRVTENKNNGVTSVTGVTSLNIKGNSATPDKEQSVTGVTPLKNKDFIEPEEEERPCFRVLDSTQHTPTGRKLKAGLWYFGIKHGRDEAQPQLTRQWICSPLHIDAVTSDTQESNFGRLLRFCNTYGRWREWAMPMELLRGSGEDLRGMLLGMGVLIDSGTGRSLLSQYLSSTVPQRRVLCALQTGWHGRSFVLPDTVIGPGVSDMIFQSPGQHDSEYTNAGNMAGWQQDIARLAVGNPLLALAMSAAFAGPLLEPCHMEGGGIHFIGSSSTGKTTVLQAAVSVWGGPGFRRSWRATANGMEGTASLFNDSLLALDEISECDPKEVGTIVYTLGNGTGKQRASRSGAARSVTRWRCIVISSGERSIETTMEEGGHRIKAGQSVRLLNIPASRTHGAWDALHETPTGTAFSDAIKRAAATHYGHAGRAFLERLTHDERDLCAFLERIKALPEFNPPDCEGQETRAAARFALMALAGELATEYGLTGWPEGEAIRAAAECFLSWRNARDGKGNSELHQIVQRVTDFIDRHGDSRFSDAVCPPAHPVRDRAGWWRDESGKRFYLFNSSGMREALRGFDFNSALALLKQAGILTAGRDKSSVLARCEGRERRVYRILVEDHHGA
jgi:putative DNA primase/helicase